MLYRAVLYCTIQCRAVSSYTHVSTRSCTRPAYAAVHTLVYTRLYPPAVVAAGGRCQAPLATGFRLRLAPSAERAGGGRGAGTGGGPRANTPCVGCHHTRQVSLPMPLRRRLPVGHSRPYGRTSGELQGGRWGGGAGEYRQRPTPRYQPVRHGTSQKAPIILRHFLVPLRACHALSRRAGRLLVLQFVLLRKQ